MIKKEITLCGKQVTLAYCYATEISYKILSDEDITLIMKETVRSVNSGTMPDTRKSLYLILASMQAYYESEHQKSPVTDEDLMYRSSPEEIGAAIGTIIGLRAEFYKIPKNEPDDKQNDKDKEKNV